MSRAEFAEALNRGWKAFHRLSLALELAVLKCGDRDEVVKHLEQAVWRHIELTALEQKRSKVATDAHASVALQLEWATRSVTGIFFAILRSLGGKQLGLWQYRFVVDEELAPNFMQYRVLLYSIADGSVKHSHFTDSSEDASMLAAVWRTLLRSPEVDVKLHGILRDGMAVDCDVRVLRRKDG